MVYQGQYGSPRGSTGRKLDPPADLEKSVAKYKELFETYASHPSILIYILSNELPTSGSRGKAFHEYLQKAHAALKPWDPTRFISATPAMAKAAREMSAMCIATGDGITTAF